MKQDITEFTKGFSYVKMIRLADNTLEMHLSELDTANGSAEIALDELKLIKQFLQGKKGILREQLKDIRQERRKEQANQMVMPRGGGMGGMFGRFGVALLRQSKRASHDDRIKPYEDAIQHINELMLGVDTATLHIKTALKASG